MSRFSVSRFVDNGCYFAVQIAVFSWMMIILSLTSISMAQTLDPNGGSPPFITTVNGQLDQLNLPSGNIIIQLPVRSKAGKYLTSFSLVGNSNVYIGPPPYPTYLGAWYMSSGISGALSGAPIAQNVGTIVTSQITEYIQCTGQSDPVYGNFTIVEPNGTLHPLPTAITVDLFGCQNSSASGSPADGSGYTFTVQVVNRNLNETLWDKAGDLLNTTCQGHSYCASDSDGVTMYGGTGLITGGPIVDTLGQTIINATLNHTGNSWLDKYQYADVSGNTQTVQVNSGQIGTILTAFGCNGIVDVLPSPSFQAPTSIVYPDGESISLTYEKNALPAWRASYGYTTILVTGIVDSNGNLEGISTYGTSGTSQPAWNKTVGGTTKDGTVVWTNYGNVWTSGRLASITYPQGGSVSYSYSGSFCPAGTHTITRTVNDNNGNSNPWTYQFTYTTESQNHNVILTQTVTETDPVGNVTILYYGGGCNSNSVCRLSSPSPTQILRYQGAAGASNLVSEQIMCYNGNNSTASGCINPTPGAALPFSQIDTYTYLVGSNGALGLANDVQVKYDSYGNVTSNATYDYGVAFPPSGTPLSTTTTAYNTGSTCGTLAVAAMKDRPCSVTTYSSGNMVQQVTYTYSAAGHATQTSQWVSSSDSLNSSASYNANGTVSTATNAMGSVSRYAYNGTDGCNDLLPTSVTLGGLTTSTQWNCSGGVATQTTDHNGQPTNYTYNDPLWRIRSMTDPLENVTGFNYLSPTTFEVVMNFDGSSSTSDTLFTADGLGRRIFTQTRQGPGSSTFDSVQTTYGWTTGVGPFTTTSLPYYGTAAQPAPGGTGSTKTQNDAINRPISASNTGGAVSASTYSQNDLLSVLSPAPAGENNKQGQTQYDGLGRPTSACAISSIVNGNVSCGQNTNTSATGVLTTTSYTSAIGSQTVSSTRGVQTRTSASDGLGRVTSVKTPEEGMTTYTYDSWSAGLCGQTSQPGHLMLINNANGTWTCYVYMDGGLGRLSDAGYGGPAGTVGDCKHFRYDTSSNGLFAAPGTVSNAGGRLVEATTDNCTAFPPTTALTDEWFSYDADGNVTDEWEKTPHSNGYFHSTATYYANGQFASLGIPGVGTINYTLDSAGRWYSAKMGTLNLVSGVTYGPLGATQINIASGTDKDAYTYSSTTGLMTSYQLTGGRRLTPGL
jgi:hypothetical protein